MFGFAHENPQRMKKCAVGRTRFTITCLKTFASRIAVGDCRDGVLFYSYNEVILGFDQMAHSLWFCYGILLSLLLDLTLTSHLLVIIRVLGNWN